MPTHFIHLENALKRANEFIEVQNKHRALEILCDVLHSKKHRPWQKKHEEIMVKYLELCVELKQSYVAKEGIFQYKIICQQSYISSFEEVIRKYIELAERKTDAAKEESQANISEIDDLENAQTPEDILMSAVSVEGNQDRKDRVVLIPWVKFLWESYRQCLDMLKNNSKTERLYHDIAQQAFKFCIKYSRKTEFRKLCDSLHSHLDQLKRQHLLSTNQQQNVINLNSAETQAMQLETRLIQLDHAIQLELWQEAYKATDDIKKFNLMNLTKKGFGKPQLIASYYQKLALVFWKANSYLFHATALFRLFYLSKDLRKNITSDDIQKMASRLVLATLSIPIPAIRPEIDKLIDTEENIIEQHHRNLSLLLGITSKPPTRAMLIKDLKRMGVLQCASEPIQELYQLLEIEFNPLGICGRVQSIIDYIERLTTDQDKVPEAIELRQYVPALKEVTVIRLIREVAQVYRTIKFKRLLELCPFVDSIYLEKLVVESARRHDLQVRIDHRQGCFVFGTVLRVSTGEEYIEGPYLQSMPNEQMRRQLVSMYSSLQKALHLIEPDTIRSHREELKRKIMANYFTNADNDHQMILNRQRLIEERREEMEKQGIIREMDQRKRAEEEEAKRREAEKHRLSEESKERERLKREKDEKEWRKQVTMDQLKKMKDVMPDLEFDNLDDDELARLRPQDLQQKRVEQLERERRDQLTKQRKLERKVDHFERAKRLEELPSLQAQYEEWRVKDQELWEEAQLIKIEVKKDERVLALTERERFRRVLLDKEEFEKRVLEGRREEYEQKLIEFDKIVEDERKKRLEQRKKKRIEERQVAYRKQEELKRREEELKRFAEADAIQQRRMKEIEEKLSQKNAARFAPPPSSSTDDSNQQSLSSIKPKDPSTTKTISWRDAPPASAAGGATERKDIPPPGGRPLAPSNRSSFPRREERPPSSVADSASDWRSGPAAGSADQENKAPQMNRDQRHTYGGRHSEGRSRFDNRDNRDSGPGGSDSRPPPDRARAPYSGRESDSGIRRNDRGFNNPSRDGDFGKSQQQGVQESGNWRNDNGPTPARGAGASRDVELRSSQQPTNDDEDDGGQWMKVRTGKQVPHERRGLGAPPPNPRYGGRDSARREDRHPPPPPPPRR